MKLSPLLKIYPYSQRSTWIIYMDVSIGLTPLCFPSSDSPPSPDSCSLPLWLLWFLLLSRSLFWTMTPQHTRNVFHRAAYPSNAVDDSDIQHRRYDCQYSFSIPSHVFEKTRNQIKNNSSRQIVSSYSWNYSPLSERGFRRPIVPTIEYSNKSHQIVSHPTPSFPASRYRPYFRRSSAFPGAKRDMRSMGRPSGATTVSSYWAPPLPSSMMSTSNVELSRQSFVGSQRTHGTSGREGDNIRKGTEGNMNEAFHRPRLQTAVPRQYILCHPSGRTAMAPPPVNVPQPTASLLNGDPLAFLKHLEGVNYLDIYPSLDRMPSSEPARSIMCAREVQRGLAGMSLLASIYFSSFVI